MRPGISALGDKTAPGAPARSALGRLGLAALALMACLAWQPAASAAPVQSITQPSEQVLHVTTTYDALLGIPEQPEEVTGPDGATYMLRHVGEPYVAEGAVHQRDYSVTVELLLSVEDYDDYLLGPDGLLAAFPPEYLVDEDGFAGPIGLKEAAAEPVYVSIEEPVERTMTIEGLPYPDVSLLPASAEFSVASDESPDATCDKLLDRLGASFEVSGRAPDGRPASYTATVVFRGMQSRLALDCYLATAAYSGSVPASEQLFTQTSVYVRAPEPPAPPPAADDNVAAAPPVWPGLTAPLPAAPAPLPPPAPIDLAALQAATIQLHDTFDYLPLVAGGALVTLLVTLVLFWTRPDARLVRQVDSRQQVLLARRLRIVDKTAVFAIPASFDLARLDATSALLLSGSRWQKTEAVELQIGGQMVYRAAPSGRIELGQMLAADAAQVIAALDAETLENVA